MVRPPWSEKGGVKKGPWTPEEDAILLSYIQEHGPGNWTSIPAATGLLRCSKSCRLRWINYLRPGIKRGNFTPHEEGMIIHLQALLGNKWAAIATYLPQRTDNDIKNFWNSHLKKRIKKPQSAAMAPQNVSVHGSKTYNMAEDSSAYYASSVENISTTLQTWITSSSSSVEGNIVATAFDHNTNRDNFCRDFGKIPTAFCDDMQWCRLQENRITSDDHELEKNSSLDRGLINGSGIVDQEKFHFFHEEEEIDGNPPFSILEDWLLEENGANQGARETDYGLGKNI